MRFERTTKKALTRDIYKDCDGEQTKSIIGEYSHNSTWKPKDIIRTIIEACFQKTSLEYCLVTLGEWGAFAASKQGENVYAPAYTINVVDSCGAGDAFTAGFLHMLLQNQGLRKACKFGNALGAMVAEQHGATQTITPEEIEGFMQTRKTIVAPAEFQKYSKIDD